MRVCPWGFCVFIYLSRCFDTRTINNNKYTFKHINNYIKESIIVSVESLQFIRWSSDIQPIRGYQI